jgi:hypothetical protein
MTCDSKINLYVNVCLGSFEKNISINLTESKYALRASQLYILPNAYCGKTSSSK